jgi:uncharacterized membrane protein YvbJ
LREEDLPVMTAADAVVGRPGWPCQTCGAANPLEATVCTKCGSGFLADAKETVKIALPVIGNVTKLSTGARVALMIGGGGLVMVLFFVVLLLLGSIF